jgi:predicted aldo/keto reductase-like oxidoreductase
VLGFGAMRLPLMSVDTSKINEPEAIKMIRFAIDNGVNYVDTAYPYHQGQSEILVGKALNDGYREKVRLATKMPSWLVESYDDFDKFLEEQLSKLEIDYIDYYLIHGLYKATWPKIKDLGVFDWAKRAKNEGKIKHLGFSFHDEYELFEKILEDSKYFDFCQIQLNYMDTNYQAGLKGLKLASEKGLAVVIMEPLKGGKLAVTPPQEINEIWAKSEMSRTPAEWALQWLWNRPEVSVVLSGMSEMWHVEENLKYASRSGVGSLEDNELALYEKIKDAYNNLGFIGCTSCMYCMPCPEGVEIPKVLDLYNDYYMEGQSENVKKRYWEEINPQSQGSNCTRCGDCEEQCPQHLPIRKFMAETKRMFPKPE